MEKYHYIMDHGIWTDWPKIELDICKALKQKIFSNVTTSNTSYSLQKANFIKSCLKPVIDGGKKHEILNLKKNRYLV